VTKANVYRRNSNTGIHIYMNSFICHKDRNRQREKTDMYTDKENTAYI